MKKIIFLFQFICWTVLLNAQTPQGITFQAVARDPSGNAARLRQVYVIDRVIAGSANGSVAWEESHTVTTNGEGVFTIIVGRGTRVSGTAAAFNNIRWDLTTYFFNVRVAVAPSLPAPTWTAAANYVDMGTTQFWSVPYAMVSGSSGNASFLAGTIAPIATIGKDTDFYLNTATYELYGPKTNGAWGTAKSIIGSVGPQGVQGIQGVQGVAGPVGPQGLQGVQGVAGPQGAAGVNGKSVLNGTVNPANNIGADGDFYINSSARTLFGPKTAGIWQAGVSLVGPIGPQGLQGVQGVAGPAGPAGPAGAQGATGPQGLTGPQGPVGPIGPQGATGPQGLNGLQGPVGPIGLTGPAGPVGPQRRDRAPTTCLAGVRKRPLERVHEQQRGDKSNTKQKSFELWHSALARVHVQTRGPRECLSSFVCFCA